MTLSKWLVNVLMLCIHAISLQIKLSNISNFIKKIIWIVLHKIICILNYLMSWKWDSWTLVLSIEENIQITIFHTMLYKNEWGHQILQIYHKIGYRVTKHKWWALIWEVLGFLRQLWMKILTFTPHMSGLCVKRVRLFLDNNESLLLL